MLRKYRVDAIVLIILFFGGLVFPYVFRGTILDYSLVWYAVMSLPSVAYLALRGQKNWKKIFVGSVVFGLLFGSILEFFASATNTWVVPVTLFPFRVWGMGYGIARSLHRLYFYDCIYSCVL